MSQARGWQVAAVAFAVLFAFFVFESLQLSLGDALGPGPGFFPFCLGVLGAVLAVVLFFRSKSQVSPDAITFDRAGTRNVLAVLAGLTAASAALELVGFRLAMLALLAYLLVLLGVRRWLALALFAAAGSFGVYHVFVDFLLVPLP